MIFELRFDFVSIFHDSLPHSQLATLTPEIIPRFSDGIPFPTPLLDSQLTGSR